MFAESIPKTSICGGPSLIRKSMYALCCLMDGEREETGDARRRCILKYKIWK
jgi:hypothetical protein